MDQDKQTPPTGWVEVASAVADHLRPQAAAADVSGELPAKAFIRLREAGLIETVRLAIEAVGGAGFSRSTDLERLATCTAACSTPSPGSASSCSPAGSPSDSIRPVTSRP
jgi:alkylation response protein AidB-like acyl-CoA dehydrogenase